MNRILCGEWFGGASTHYFNDGAQSFNVTLEESQQNTFETLSNNFYFKKIKAVLKKCGFYFFRVKNTHYWVLTLCKQKLIFEYI